MAPNVSIPLAPCDGFFLLLGLVGAVLSIIPLLTGHHANCDTLQENIQSSTVSNAIIVAIGSSFPIVIETVLDLIFLPSPDIYPRLMLLSSLIFPNAMILAFPRSADVYIACVHIRDILFVGSLLSYLSRDCDNRRQRFTSVGLGSLYSVGVTMNNFALFYKSGLTHDVSLLLLALALIGILAACGHRIYQLLADKAAFDSKNIAIVFVLCLCFNICGKWIIFAAFPGDSWYTFSSAHLAAYTYLDAITSVVSVTIPGRIARFEAFALETKLHAKKEFVRYVSHEIRTPLNVVFMGIQLLPQTLAEDPSNDLKELCHDLTTACSTAIDMLNDLLLVDKIEDGQVVLDKTVVSFSRFLRKTIGMFSMQAASKGLNLRYQGNEFISPEVESLLVLIDKSKIAQVIRNLVSNALKFSPKGSDVTVRAFTLIAPERLVISTSSQSGNSVHPGTVDVENGAGLETLNGKKVLRIEIKDYGTGLSQDEQQHLFTEIVQFNAARQQGGGGSGLGLWISAAIVKKHGGKIGVESSGIPGEGCLFFIELPFAEMCPLDSCVSIDQDESLPTTSSCRLKDTKIAGLEMDQQIYCRDETMHAAGEFSEQEKASRRSNSSRRYTVMSQEYECALICDDSTLNRKMMKKLLQNDFKHLYEADDGDTALEVFVKAKEEGITFDAIFMDDGMPRMLGRDAIKELRNVHQYTGPIIAITGNILEDDTRTLKLAGATAICEKPLAREKLTAVLSDYFRAVSE